MPEETLQQLRRQLEGLARKNPDYQAYLEAVKQTEEAMRPLHVQDAYGRLPRLTREDRSRLMELHRRIGMAAEAVYRSEADPERKKLVKKLTALAAGNHRALMRYDPEQGPKTLPALLSEVRTLTLDTRGAALMKKVGASTSSRQPITFLDDKGREITGVFTPRREMRVRQTLQARMEQLAAQVSDPAGKAMLRNFINRAIERYQSMVAGVADGPEERKIAALDVFYTRITGEDDKRLEQGQPEQELEQLFANELNGRSIRKLIPKQTLKELGEAVIRISADLNVNLDHGKIPDNARLDTRNAAMSAVADLLGVPTLLARSRSMRLILPNGSEVEGTFTQEAKGLDPENPDERALNVDSSALKAENQEDRETLGKAMKALADLQILDYICGNVDRHQSNLFYQFNERGKLSVPQGIDNDCALGLLLPKAGERAKELPPLKDFRVISESMYNTVMDLTPETLRFTLRGFELSEAELDAACKRLETLKNQLTADREWTKDFPPIKQGSKYNFPNDHIRVVKDEEWAKIDFDDLTLTVQEGNEEVAGNIFAAAKTVTDSVKEEYQTRKQAYRSLRSETALGAGNRAIPSEQEKEAEKARMLASLIGQRSRQGRSSPQYDAMLDAAEKYAEFQLSLRDRIRDAETDQLDPDAPYDAVVCADDLEQMRLLAGKLQQTAQAYLDYKGGGLHLSYTAKRIEVAKLAVDLGQKAAVLKPEERDTAERNEKAALEEGNRRVGAKLEQSGWQPGKQSPYARNDFETIPLPIEQAGRQSLNLP